MDFVIIVITRGGWKIHLKRQPWTFCGGHIAFFFDQTMLWW